MPDPQTAAQSPRKIGRIIASFLFTFVLVLGLTWAHRVATMLIFYRNNNFTWHYPAIDGFNPLERFIATYGQSALLGLKTDLLFALPVALVATLLGRLGLLVSLILLAGFYAANAEHVRYNESNIDLSQIGLAASPTFLKGQTTPELLITFLALLASIGVIAWFARRRRVRYAIIAVAAALAALVALAPATARFDQPIWMQTHPFMPRIGIPELAQNDRIFPATDFAPAPAPRLPVPGQHNVLIVYLEGLSEYSLTVGQMENLQRLAAENLHFQQYIGHQLLTANGIYATHTGYLPYFTNVPMRWYDLTETAPELPVSLPVLLRAQGYHTHFLQSAPLAFMRKDTILPLLGYDQVEGAESIPDPRLVNGWGVDDLTLFEAALDRIDGFAPDQPWLMSLLTTGTHSPYNIPNDFAPQIPRKRDRATHYADAALKALLDGLDERGLLDETVVIITSDESREYSPGTQLETDIHRSWLPFVVRHPSGLKAQIDTPFAMVDARDMILAMTGDVSAAELTQIAAQRDVFVFRQCAAAPALPLRQQRADASGLRHRPVRMF